MDPVRSLLFSPGNRPALLKKLVRYRGDAVAIDLEDATPPAEKHSARATLADIVRYLREHALHGLLLVRVNEPASPHFEEDIAAALAAGVDGLMVPKLGSAGDVQRVSAMRARAESPSARRAGIIGLLETAAGVVNAESIAAAARAAQVDALGFGSEDFITEMGGIRTSEGLEVLYARSRVLLAARAAGLWALDQVFAGIRDDEAFRRDAMMGRQLGYSGKMCVVPRQVEIANEVFAPSDADVERSRRLIAAYEQARAEGRGTIDFEGGMVDEPLVRRAEAVVRLAALKT